MAATEILAPGNTATQSADVTVTAAAPVLLVMKGAAGVQPTGTSTLLVEVKTSNNTYLRFGVLTVSKAWMHLLAPGLYRVRRTAQPDNVGCDTA